MAATRGVLLVLLLAGSAQRAFAPVVKIVNGIHGVVHGATGIITDTAEKIPIIGGVAGNTGQLVGGVVDTAHTIARNVADKVDEKVQDGIDAVAPETPCYETLGCFPMTGPWRSIDRLVPTPQPPEDIDTRFYLYTRYQPERYNIQTRPEISLEESDYDGSRLTVMITHGFASTGNSSWLKEMKDALLYKIDANVIIVDWGRGARKLNYFQVTANTRVVGAEIARLCLYLMEYWNMSPTRLHLIGHSLGAHTMSYVSRNVSEIARITGLDPAQPLFETFPDEVLLDTSDASYVEIVHTDAELFIPFFGFGVIRPYGDVDFYINGGSNQPGCRLKDLFKANITSVLQLGLTLVETIMDSVGCPHGRATEVWTASLVYNNCTFLGELESDSNEDSTPKEARELLDYIIPMGLETIYYPARGSFYVETTGSKPFCIE